MLTKTQFESIKPQIENFPTYHSNDPMTDEIDRPRGQEYTGAKQEATSIAEFNNLKNNPTYELKGSLIYDHFTDGSEEHYGIIFWQKRV